MFKAISQGSFPKHRRAPRRALYRATMLVAAPIHVSIGSGFRRAALAVGLAAVAALALVLALGVAATGPEVVAPVPSSEKANVQLDYQLSHHGEFNWPRHKAVVLFDGGLR